jgi:serine/threonine-protein kinase
LAFKPGDILRDKYRVDALIGRGGMGHVFAATDLDAGTQVAVKVVSRVNVDDILLMRLHREAAAAERIQSEFVPRVFEVSGTDEGETFFVMERLHGEPLSVRIRKGGILSWPDVFHIGEDILRGLIDAHASGVIHRDLKPSNVFLAKRDDSMRAMILDFGVCKMVGVDDERLTGTGESIGTVAYMAPEQIRGAARVDERADLYAFGVLVFEMLSGRLPHEGPSQMAILASKLESAPTRLREVSRVAMPEGTDELVMRAVARDPSARFSTAEELLAAWRELAATEAMVPESVPVQEVAAAFPPPDDTTEISHPPAALLALSATESELAEAVKIAAPVVESRPTETALASQYTSHPRKPRAVRGALFLAGAALIGGLAIVAVTVTEGPDRPAATVTASEPPAESAAAPTVVSAFVAPDPVVAPTSADAAADPAVLEFPAEPSASENTHRTSRPRSHHDHSRSWSPGTALTSSAPKAVVPRITETPRY